MVSENFRIDIELLTPFYVSRPLTLDALLSAAYANMSGEHENIVLPLDKFEGIYRGSSLYLNRLHRYTNFGRIMAFRSENDLSINAFFPNSRGQKYTRVDQQRGQFKANMSLYQAIESPLIHFYGRGDGEFCSYLIQNFIPGIGKSANSGAGQIGRVVLSHEEDDFSLIDQKGRPARPVPVSTWCDSLLQNIADNPISNFSVRAPYWLTEKVRCVFTPPCDAIAV